MTTAQIDIDKVKSLLEALEQDNQDLASELLDELTRLRESELYQQLSDLTNNLHQTLDELDDHTLLMQTKHDIPDAAERLEYVIRTTEEASNSTIDKAEEALQSLEKMQDQLPAELLDDDLSDALSLAKHNLTEIMLAQSYQDLTGQVLNRVIYVIGSLEQSLIQLIENSNYDYHAIPDREKSEADMKAEEMRGMGPNVTQSSKKDVVESQDDVDSLLDDLGI